MAVSQIVQPDPLDSAFFDSLAELVIDHERRQTGFTTENIISRLSEKRFKLIEQNIIQFDCSLQTGLL